MKKTSNNTNENTNDLSIKSYKLEEIYNGVIKHKNGSFYLIEPKDLSNVVLRVVDSSQSSIAPASIVLHGINFNRIIFYPKGDESYREDLFFKQNEDFKNNFLKALIYNQLCTEANDVLIGTEQHDKYLKNLLLKANKGLERKSVKYLESVYGAEPQMLTNLFNAIDKFVGSLAKTLPHEFFYLNSIVDEYNENPAKYIDRQINLDVLK